MTTITEQARQAELALAAYANLTVGDATKAALIDAGFSSKQADQFREKYTVIDQYNATGSATGLSATVFEDKATHVRYLAIRGTDDLYDLATDLIDVAALGGTKYQAQYQALKAKVGTWQADGTLPNGERSGQQQYTVTGHSLGGFLASALSTDFQTTIGYTYLSNAPGFGSSALLGGISPLLKVIQLLTGTATIPSFDASKISNVKGDAGISLIAGLGTQATPPTWIAIENQLDLSVSNRATALNHSQQVLTDALAVYALYSTLSPSLTLDQIGGLLKAASAQNKQTLESSLDALRTTLQGKSVVDSTPTSEGNRESFYTNLYNPQNSAEYQALAGSATLSVLANVSRDALVSQAKTDFGDFLAVRYLLPIALEGSWGVLGTVHTDLYAEYEADKALTPAQRAAGQANYSEAYLADRAAMLTWKLKFNTKDIATSLTFAHEDVLMSQWQYFKDYASGQEIVLGNPPGGQTDRRQILFGSDAQTGEVLTGQDQNDRIYAGAGADILVGGQGNDYLEGNADNDNLTGGEGQDALYGGTGDDTLTGGKDNDVLYGGTGSDTYKFTSGDGWDTLTDSDGSDTLVGATGADILEGGKGNDSLVGGCSNVLCFKIGRKTKNTKCTVHSERKVA